MADSLSSESHLDRSNEAKSGKDGQKELLIAGSTALLSNFPSEAAEKYEAVLHKMSIKLNQKLSMAQVVLKYALCIAWIKCKDYEHTVQAAESLQEMIATGFANKLPALYLALARAYFALNRFKIALESIEKGLKLLGHSDLKQFSWPGLQQNIEETEKNFLLKEFLNLQKDCNKCHPPDAMCGYNKCEERSGQFIPSKEIYFTDLNFQPFLYLKCDVDCKSAYHDSCRKQLKNFEDPKDLLGTACFSDRCMGNLNISSIIVDVQLIGQNGFDKPLQTWQLNDANSQNSTVKNHNMPAVESSYGSLEKKNDSGVGPSGMTLGSTAKHTVSYEDGRKSALKVERLEKEAPAFASTSSVSHNSNHNFEGHALIFPTYVRQQFFHRPPVNYFYNYAAKEVRYPSNVPVAQLPLQSSNQSVLPPLQNHHPGFLQHTPAHSRPYHWFRPPIGMVHPQGYNFHSPQFPPQSGFVEVVVRHKSELEAGTVLYVPIGPGGGQVQIRPSSQHSLQDSKTSKLSSTTKVTELQDSPQLLSGWEGSDSTNPKALTQKQPNSTTGSVQELSDPVTDNPIPSLPNQAYAASCSPPVSERLSPKQVVIDFKKLVHELAKGAGESAKNTSVAMKDMKTSHDVNMNNEEDKELVSMPVTVVTSPLSSNPTPRASHTSAVPTCLRSVLSSDLLMMQASTFQGKPNNSPSKEVLYHSDQAHAKSSSLSSSLCSSQDDIRSEPYDSDRFETFLEVLQKCRNIKFGYLEDEHMNPELQCFGHDISENSVYVEPYEIDKVDAVSADYVFSYYYTMFDNNGPYQIDELQETWKNTCDDLYLPETFTVKYPSISEFLLKSKRFAAIDDLIGTSKLLPAMFSKAEKELAESISYLLFSQVVKPRSKEECFHPDSCLDFQRNCNDSIPVHHGSHFYSQSSMEIEEPGVKPSIEDSEGCKKSEMAVSGNRDSNDNPISTSLSFNSNNFVTTPAVNGCLKPISEPFPPRGSEKGNKLEVVYMSDDDEEIEVSLGDIDNENLSTIQATVDEEPVSQIPLGIHREIAVSPTKNSEGNKITHMFKEQGMQTDTQIDSVKVNLEEEKEYLKKDLSELKYEKAELHQRVESLQRQVESTRLTLESQHVQALKQVQEKLEGKLQKKSDKVKAIEEKCVLLEKEMNQLKDHLADREKLVTDSNSHVEKLRRNHAKEINNLNNFVKRLQEEKQLKEEEFLQALQCQDQNFIKLWKDFCEFKIKKFNHVCNDRINVLSQLRDMMSDTVQPTKLDIKSTIEKYEELMISVTKKNAEVNDMYNREMERLRNGIKAQPLSVIDVPDITNLTFPPDGAFEYLLKPKQEEFGVPRNHFSSFSRFYPRTFGSNGTQSMNQTREQEVSQGFPSASTSSLFGETSNLWNVFSNSSPASSAMPFDVSTNGPHLPVHQSFSSSSPMLPPQPPLSMLPNAISYQPSSNQNSSLQGIIGQTRATPSPSLPFLSGNGPVFNNNSSAAVLTKAPTLGAIQKPTPSPVSSSTIMKSTPQVISASASPAAVLGAIPKPRVQTATASITPIVPSKSIRPMVRSPKTNESNYEKLMRSLQKMFPTRIDSELTQALKMAREKNGNSLSSLTHSEIVAKVEEILSKHFRKQTSIMGWEKFGQAAWGTAKPKVVEWKGSNQEECVICMNLLNSQEVYTLECKHAFHKECIRKWLMQDSVCPNCRKHSTMLDEFPPLG